MHHRTGHLIILIHHNIFVLFFPIRTYLISLLVLFSYMLLMINLCHEIGSSDLQGEPFFYFGAPLWKKITPREIAGCVSGLLTHFFNNPKSLTYSEQIVPWHTASLSTAHFYHIQRSRALVMGSGSVLYRHIR